MRLYMQVATLPPTPRDEGTCRVTSADATRRVYGLITPALEALVTTSHKPENLLYCSTNRCRTPQDFSERTIES